MHRLAEEEEEEEEGNEEEDEEKQGHESGIPFENLARAASVRFKEKADSESQSS